MNFKELRDKFLQVCTVNGEYKSGKMNSSAATLLKAGVDELKVPGFSTRSEKIFALLHNFEEAPKCLCGKYLKIKGNQQLQKYCSAKCSASSPETKAKRAETNNEKYGGASPMCSKSVLAKTQETNIQKYGKPSSWAAADIRNKAAQHNLDKYGFENPAKSAVVKRKIVESHAARSPKEKAETKLKTIRTMIEKYDADHPMHVPHLKEKQISSLIESWADKSLAGFLERIYEKTEVLPEFTEWHGLARPYEWKHDACGKTFTAVARSIRVVNCPFCRRKSKVQEAVEQMVASTSLKYIVEDRKLIAPYELDILVPEKNVAIEVNGVYWHHDKSRQQPLLNKTKMFSGQLMHFWDFEILEKPSIVETMIKSKLGVLPRVFARKTKIRYPTSKEAKMFFERNHIQGHANASLTISLELNGEDLAMCSFGKPRFSKDHDWELIRFASEGVTVVGGLSKILKEFSKGREGQTLMTFADKRFSKANVYLATGFTKIIDTHPSYFYFKGNTILSRWKAMKHKLKNIVKDYDETLSERELMLRDGWMRCVDCGNVKLYKTM